MVNRSNIGRRVRANSLKKLNADKAANPEKYQHETSDRSSFLALKYDFEHGYLPPHKKEQYLKLKEKFKNETDKQKN